MGGRRAVKPGRRSYGALAAAALLCGSIGQVEAGIDAPASVASLSSAADAVVVGSASSRAVTGSATTFLLEPVRVLRGSFPGPAAVTVAGVVAARTEASASLYGLWFLRRSGDVWEALPVVAGAAFLEQGLIDKVVLELRAAQQSPATSAGAYQALATIRARQSADSFRHLGELPPQHLDSCPVAALVRTWDGETIDRVRGALSAAAETAFLLQGLCAIESPAAVAGLVGLLELTPPGSPEERCALEALRTIHTPEALTALAPLLSASDPERQYLAISAFALAANGYPPGDARDTTGTGGPLTTAHTLAHFPSFEEFRRDPAPHAGFWQVWWECEACRTDITPPSAAVVSPHDGDVVSGTVNVTIEASDDVRLGTVRFQVDGSDRAVLTAPPYAVAWDTRTSANGVHEVRAVAADAVGNEQASGAVQVRVDNDITPPRLTVSAAPPYLWPPNGQMVPVRVFVSVSDDRDPAPRVTLVSIACDDGCVAASSVAGAAFGTSDLDFSLAAARQGNGTGRTYTITYDATDAAGNRTVASAKVVVPHDRSR
jgi:Bacterial Ig domain